MLGWTSESNRVKVVKSPAAQQMALDWLGAYRSSSGLGPLNSDLFSICPGLHILLSLNSRVFLLFYVPYITPFLFFFPLIFYQIFSPSLFLSAIGSPFHLAAFAYSHLQSSVA